MHAMPDTTVTSVSGVVPEAQFLEKARGVTLTLLTCETPFSAVVLDRFASTPKQRWFSVNSGPFCVILR